MRFVSVSLCRRRTSFLSSQMLAVGVVCSECAEHLCDAMLSLVSVDVPGACRVDG